MYLYPRAVGRCIIGMMARGIGESVCSGHCKRKSVVTGNEGGCDVCDEGRAVGVSIDPSRAVNCLIWRGRRRPKSKKLNREIGIS